MSKRWAWVGGLVAAVVAVGMTAQQLTRTDAYPRPFAAMQWIGEGGEGGAGPGFVFAHSAIGFDNKRVLGAPYMAEAVTEFVQTLADGNRITRKTTANLYRDSAGRTRREQNLGGTGPLGAAAEDRQQVFVNDPVAGVNYILNPKERTARKLRANHLRLEGQDEVILRANQFHLEGQDVVISETSGDKRAKVETIVRREGPGHGHPGPAALVSVPPLAELSVQAVDGPTPVLSPRSLAPITLKFFDQSLRQVFESLGRLAGLKIVMDPRVRDERVTFDVAGVTFEEALSQLCQPQHLRYKVVDSNTLLITPAASERDRTFELATAEPVELQAGPSESLGKQVIEGVEAEGTRTTVTIPAGKIGNEQALQIVTERWYSPELQTVVLSRHNDPRFGDTTYRMTGVVRAEPQRALFEVPADFQVKEGPPPSNVVIRKIEKIGTPKE